MRWGKICIAVLLIERVTACSSLAEPISSANSNTSAVEIEASESLEWQSELKFCIARGGAHLRQSDIDLHAQTLTAYYRDLSNGQTQIWRAIAEGNVVISCPSSRVLADRAIYDLDRGVIVLTGHAMRLEHEHDVITARDSLEYWYNLHLAVARGNAVLLHGRDVIRSELMTGQFINQPGRLPRLGIVNAIRNVSITTQTNAVNANEAVYNVDTGIATLIGAVRLTHGDSVLIGDLAETNVRTGISRLGSTRLSNLKNGFGGHTRKPRVKGILQLQHF
jgi:lipopolysaccharide export system protein LptA